MMSENLRVTGLTETALGLIEDRASLLKDTPDYEAMRFGRTYVEATHRMWEDIVEELKDYADEYAALVGGNVDSDREERIEFAERSARRSIIVTISRIQAVLNQ